MAASGARFSHRWRTGGSALAAACLAACSATGAERLHEEERERVPKARHAPVEAALLAVAGSGTGIPATPGTWPPPAGPAASFDAPLPLGMFSDWEPHVACSPDGRQVYMATTRYGDPRSFSQPHIPLRISLDGGRTWQPDQYVENTRAWEADPQLAVSDDGTVFVVWLSLFNPGVSFKKSTDHGATWTTPIPLAPPGSSFPPGWSDKPWLVVHPNGQDLFVAFNASDPYVVVSHDGGNTWGAPIRTAANGRTWFHSGGCVAPNGDVYLASADYRWNFKGQTPLNVTRSTDNGATWSNQQIDVSEEMPGCGAIPGCYFGFLGPQSAIAADAAGTLMYVYNAGSTKNKPQQIWARTSTDGVNWSAAQRISLADPRVHNGFPAVSVGREPGDFRIVWQDTRSNGQWNTWYKRTADGGATWEDDVRLSSRYVPVVYKTQDGYDFVFGDYLGLCTDDWGTNHVIWGEGANYNGPGSTWYTTGW